MYCTCQMKILNKMESTKTTTHWDISPPIRLVPELDLVLAGSEHPAAVKVQVQHLHNRVETSQASSTFCQKKTYIESCYKYLVLRIDSCALSLNSTSSNLCISLTILSTWTWSWYSSGWKWIMVSTCSLTQLLKAYVRPNPNKDVRASDNWWPMTITSHSQITPPWYDPVTKKAPEEETLVEKIIKNI